MQRDFIIVVGMQGFGKSTWTELYSRAQSRVLCFDPKAAHPADYMTPPEEWLDDLIHRRIETFRFGTHYPEEIEMFGSAAYAAGNCTFVMEECAMLFERGENVAPWLRPLIYMGREPQLNLILVAQRANSFPVGVRSQASRIVTFLQTEPSDVVALAQRIGGEYADEIKSLPLYECLDWQAGQGVRRYGVHP
jgi:hypothetical protein